MKSKPSSRTDIHTKVTDEIIQSIEAGVSTFEMPWHRSAQAGFPRNPATNNVYRGVNTLTLWVTSRRNGYASPYWASYLQWRSIGAQVRKEENGTVVVFYKRLEEDEVIKTPDETGKSEKVRAVMRHSYVFNGDQVDNWEPVSPILQQQNANDYNLSTVDTFIKALSSDIRYGSDSAYYNKTLDRIYMPDKTEFRETKSRDAVEGFYATLLHEHIHWSGHLSRLNRDLSGRFGSSAYAMEELVAELGSAFLCASLGINTYPRSDHASYIDSWLKVLKENKSAIFTASSMASVASQFLETLTTQSIVEETT